MEVCLLFQFNQVTVTDENSPTKCPMTTKLVLDMDAKTKETIIEVFPKLIKKLKPHQVEGKHHFASI